LDPIPVGLGSEDHVAVRVHRALGGAGGTRGVGEKRYRVEVKLDGRRLLASMRIDQFDEVERSVVPLAPHLGEEPSIHGVLEFEFRRRDRQAYRRVLANLPDDVAVEALQADDGYRTGIVQQAGDL